MKSISKKRLFDESAYTRNFLFRETDKVISLYLTGGCHVLRENITKK